MSDYASGSTPLLFWISHLYFSKKNFVYASGMDDRKKPQLDKHINALVDITVEILAPLLPGERERRLALFEAKVREITTKH